MLLTETGRSKINCTLHFHCHFNLTQTWISYVDAETKQQSMQWHHSGSLELRKSGQLYSGTKRVCF